MGLRISLKDGERIIINGAALKARGRLSFDVESKAAILKGKDIMTPEQANTPARRLYFAVMLAYIDDGARAQHHAHALDLVSDLVSALANPEAISRAVDVAQLLSAGQHYKALNDCRWLIAYEDTVLPGLQGPASFAVAQASSLPAAASPAAC